MEWLGLGLSFGFVFLIIGISTLLQKLHLLGEEGTRKFVHIGVAHWWLIAMFFFHDVWWAMVAPIAFIILNYISYKKKVFAAIERSQSNDFGTVFYPISLLILVIATFYVQDSPIEIMEGWTIPPYSYIGALGIFIMGYGDGFAAVVGSLYGKHALAPRKSLEGTITMAIVSFLVSFVIMSLFTPEFTSLGILGVSLTIALVATALEFYTPSGLDNLTVPLVSSLLYYLFIVLL